MTQIARNLTDGGEGFLRDARYLIHDRDPMFTRQFITILRAAPVNDQDPVERPRARAPGRFTDHLAKPIVLATKENRLELIHLS
jgi:hypothetical protein